MTRQITKMILAASVTATALLGSVAGAQATLTVNPAVGALPTGNSFVNFDDLALGNGGGTSGGVSVSFNSGDGQVVVGAVGGKYAMPYLSNNNGVPFGNASNGQDGTKYLTTGIGTLTLAFTSAQQYFGLLWGSVDNYNTLSFYNGATQVGSITGTDVWAAANGDQGMNGTFYVNIFSDLAFDSVRASSSQYAFEFDNVSLLVRETKVPEPATLALLGTGLAGFVALRRRRKIAGQVR